MSDHLPPAWPFGPQRQAFFMMEPAGHVASNAGAPALQHNSRADIHGEYAPNGFVPAMSDFRSWIASRWLALCETMMVRQVRGAPQL
jgi:hypothetical protein